MPPLVETTTAWTRSPTVTSMSPSAFFSSSISIVASPLPPTSTNATSGPIATIVPSMVWPCSTRFGWVEAANIAAKSSVGSVTAHSRELVRLTVPRARYSFAAAALELIALVGEQHVEAGERPVAAAHIGLQLQLDIVGQVRGAHLLLKRPQTVAQHDHLMEEGINRPALFL